MRTLNLKPEGGHVLWFYYQSYSNSIERTVKLAETRTLNLKREGGHVL
jgi:hypothetical protein